MTPTILLMSPRGGLGCLFSLWAAFPCGGSVLSLSAKSFYLLLQVIAIRCIMTIITMKMTVLVSRPLPRVSLQLARKHQGSFILYLHQDLINWGIKRGETCEPPSRGFTIDLQSWLFPSLSCHASSCLSFSLGFSSQASSVSSAFTYLITL